jgi:hypothetical protein
MPHNGKFPPPYHPRGANQRRVVEVHDVERLAAERSFEGHEMSGKLL